MKDENLSLLHSSLTNKYLHKFPFSSFSDTDIEGLIKAFVSILLGLCQHYLQLNNVVYKVHISFLIH